MSDGIRIEERAVPTAPGAAGWDDFVAAVAVENAREVANYGSAELVHPAEEQLMFFLNPHEPHRWLVALDGDRVVGHGLLETRHDEAADTAWLGAATVPELRDELEPRLWDRLEAMARESGARKAVVYASNPPTDGPTLSPPTGAGSVPADAYSTRVLLARGYRLEQVERASRYELPGDPGVLADRLAAAERAADGYDVVLWSGPTPPEHREDIATLNSRMSTDAPSAGLEEPEDPWSVERLIEAEAGWAEGLDFLTAAARHRASGRLVAFTQFKVPRSTEAAAIQWATLVLREHRGHRLGMLVKAANLRALLDQHPGHPSVLTWNAEENRPMLDVNEALGFVPIGYEGAWRLDL